MHSVYTPHTEQGPGRPQETQHWAALLWHPHSTSRTELLATNLPPFGKKEQPSVSERLPRADTMCTEPGTFLIGHPPQSAADCPQSPDEDTGAQKRELIYTQPHHYKGVWV